MNYFKEERSRFISSGIFLNVTIKNRHLLKEIRRKNSESSTPNLDKTLPMLESTQTRQDLAAVVHEVRL